MIKREFLILAMIVLAALWFVFGCSIRFHCTKGVSGSAEKYGPKASGGRCPRQRNEILGSDQDGLGVNSQEMCLDGCYQLFVHNVQNPDSFRKCGNMCTTGCSSAVGWPTAEDCMTDCQKRYAPALTKAEADCKGQPISCTLNSAAWKERDQCNRSCVNK
jgi:hypothetical protein